MPTYVSDTPSSLSSLASNMNDSLSGYASAMGNSRVNAYNQARAENEKMDLQGRQELANFFQNQISTMGAPSNEIQTRKLYDLQRNLALAKGGRMPDSPYSMSGDQVYNQNWGHIEGLTSPEQRQQALNVQDQQLADIAQKKASAYSSNQSGKYAGATSLMKQAAAMGLSPGTQEYNDYITDNSGSGVEITNVPNPYEFNEQQAASYQYGTRMDLAEQQLSALESGIANKSFPESVLQSFQQGLVGGTMSNRFVSEEMQLFDQASRNFINAVLRRESGAVISQEEFDNAYRQYLPKPGDTKAVLEQKRANRKLATENMLRLSGQLGVDYKAPRGEKGASLGDVAQQVAGGSGEALTAVNPETGERIISFDGGQTWQAAQ